MESGGYVLASRGRRQVARDLLSQLSSHLRLLFPPLSQPSLLYPETHGGFIFCPYEIQLLLKTLCDTEKPPFGENELGQGGTSVVNPKESYIQQQETTDANMISPLEQLCGVLGRTTHAWAEQDGSKLALRSLTTGRSPGLLGSHGPPPYSAAGAQDKGPCSKETKRYH